MPRAKNNNAAKSPKTSPASADYRHAETAPARPDVGTQPQFKKRKPPQTYRYDSSLAPALDWDGANPAREQGEALIAALEASIRELRERLEQGPPVKAKASSKAAAGATQPEGASALSEAERAAILTALAEQEATIKKLKALSRPFLNWTGKAERLSFDVPTLPLFVHERLSTQAILETLKGHKRDTQLGLFDLFADPGRPIHDQVLKPYEHAKWVNRMILGDSLVVMNSLLHYEGMAGQVQMIYMDPPYGVKFGSNFQPFVRKRDVSHNDDEDMTREPEMVQAYRDTWELGLHSYLTYLRDRLLLSRELLSPSGSIFVQISDENLHHVREVMDEVFGADRFVAIIAFQKTGSQAGASLGKTLDFLIWYCKDADLTKYRQLYSPRKAGDTTLDRYDQIELQNGSTRRLTAAELRGESQIPSGRRFRSTSLFSDGGSEHGSFEYEFEGRKYRCPANSHWKTTRVGLDSLATQGRLLVEGARLRYKRYADDFPVVPIDDRWESMQIGTSLLYVVQTSVSVVERCVLMTTDPGDLVLDPTCGSGTSAYAAEHWGRRWITIDTSRVPLALARQRLLTATYPWYGLQNELGGPSQGFVYRRKQNLRGEEDGGIVPHVMLKNIANNEPPLEEVLVDRPEKISGITRVSGPFTVEATIPTPVFPEDGFNDGATQAIGEAQGNFAERLLEVLRKSPVLRLEGNRTVTLKNLRRPVKTLSLSAEGIVANGTDKPVAFVFGPENGAIVERLVFEAAREANAKNYAHLYVIGFAIQPNARALIEQCEAAMDIAATYVQATPDLMMGDLLKNMRSSQIFSVCGLPEIDLRKTKPPKDAVGDAKKAVWFEVELLGLDVFDPVTMELEHRKGNDVPAWFVDTDYNGLSFHVSQAFFPKTAAWDNLKRALKGEYDDDVWSHLAGTVSVPFQRGDHGEVAVKVIDHRGNELLVVKKLEEAK